MVRAASLFSQLLTHIPRSTFRALVAKHRAERAAKGFSCWTQLVAMLFCQLAKADSLREICNGMACCEGKLNHLGVDQPPNKSTLSYANDRRPAALYEDLFWGAAELFCQSTGLGARKSKFRFKNKLLSKALKQNLKVKTFVGTSENALRIQIWTALVALLLLRWLHHLSKAAWSLSNLAAMVRLSLFTYRDLMAWLHDPFGKPPLEPAAGGPVQLSLDFGQAVA